MAESREESEWWRLSHLEAWIANKFRFSAKEKIIHPRDINPYYKRPVLEQKNAKEVMAESFACHPEIPMVRMIANGDGTWRTEPMTDGK